MLVKQYCLRFRGQ